MIRARLEYDRRGRKKSLYARDARVSYQPKKVKEKGVCGCERERVHTKT